MENTCDNISVPSLNIVSSNSSNGKSRSFETPSSTLSSSKGAGSPTGNGLGLMKKRKRIAWVEEEVDFVRSRLIAHEGSVSKVCKELQETNSPILQSHPKEVIQKKIRELRRTLVEEGLLSMKSEDDGTSQNGNGNPNSSQTSNNVIDMIDGDEDLIVVSNEPISPMIIQKTQPSTLKPFVINDKESVITIWPIVKHKSQKVSFRITKYQISVTITAPPPLQPTCKLLQSKFNLDKEPIFESPIIYTGCYNHDGPIPLNPDTATTEYLDSYYLVQVKKFVYVKECEIVDM